MPTSNGVCHEKSGRHRSIRTKNKKFQSTERKDSNARYQGCGRSQTASPITTIPARQDAPKSPSKWSASTPLRSTSLGIHIALSSFLSIQGLRVTRWGREKQRKAMSTTERTAGKTAGRAAGRAAWRATGRAARSRETIRSLVSWPC